MSDLKELKKKSFADIFKNILKETKKEKEVKKEENNENNSKDVAVKDVQPISGTNKNEKIIFYSDKKNSINDETIFDFTIKGGPRHTDLLVACASYKNSLGGGEPVALNCKWFNVTDNNELREIEGVTGAFYQPCADDIGTRFLMSAYLIKF